LNPTVRRILTRRFPYRVFFIVRLDAIIVFAVLHAARHDRVWTHRADHEHDVRAPENMHHWYVASREHAWDDLAGNSGFIDLLLKHKQFSTFRLIGCKRVKADDARLLQWLSLVEQAKSDFMFRSSAFEVEADLGANGLRWVADVFQPVDGPDLNRRHYLSNFFNRRIDKQVHRSLDRFLPNEMFTFWIVFFCFVASNFYGALSWNHVAGVIVKQ